MPDQDPILLQTKLHRPPITRGLLDRPQLYELLNSGINRPLTLIVASAGFGKTTLASSWLAKMAAGQFASESTIPAAWLSLDETDSDLDLFLRYFIAALRTIFNEACQDTLALLQARQQPPQAVLYATLNNDLANLPGELILVLDDYHTLHGVEVHNLLGDMVRHWPTLLHLVVISRISPPIPLSSFRAKGLISEIRTRDLRFSAEESSSYIHMSQSILLNQNVLPLLEERFEGWPVGLHLAALSFRTRDSQEAVLAALSSENANITGYLVDEVLAHLPPAIHTFLLKTAILDRFCAPLCQAVIGNTDPAWNARLCLDWIERSELFITNLDNQREWYHYHHLFQELLQQRLSAEMTPDQVAGLHLLASAWYEEHGLVEEALHHAMAAGNVELTARQMISGLCEVVNREDRLTLERWLRLLPEDAVRQHPGLLIIKAWALEFSWRLDLQAQTLQQAEALIDATGSISLKPDELQALRGQILALKAQQAFLSNRAPQAIDFARQALQLLPAAWEFVRGGSMLYLGMAMQANGQALEAEKLLLDEYEVQSDKTGVYPLNLLRVLCFIYLNSGRLERCEQTARLLLDGSTTRKIAILKNWSDWFLGLVQYQWNELGQAAYHFLQIVENRYAAQVTTMRDAFAGIALIYHIQGEQQEAWRTFESISRYDLELRGIEDERTRSLYARLMLLQGELESAGRWADGYIGPPPDVPLLWLAEPQLMRVRVLLARGKSGDLQQAQQLLDALEDITDRTHNTRFKIQILAMRAVALDALGESGAAACRLKQAVELGRLGRFIRVLVDLGNPMLRMLHRLLEAEPSLNSIPTILAAFPQEEAKPALILPTGNGALPEPLTPRELEILGLLRGPLSIKEIAGALYISYATAKRHTVNIYAKLGVNQRWDAVTKAEELNILPPR
jgi:LuxR family maltose regulon positive regulatory protein